MDGLGAVTFAAELGSVTVMAVYPSGMPMPEFTVKLDASLWLPTSRSRRHRTPAVLFRTGVVFGNPRAHYVSIHLAVVNLDKLHLPFRVQRCTGPDLQWTKTYNLVKVLDPKDLLVLVDEMLERHDGRHGLAGVEGVREHPIPQLVFDGEDVRWWHGWNRDESELGTWPVSTGPVVFTVQQGVLFAATYASDFRAPPRLPRNQARPAPSWRVGPCADEKNHDRFIPPPTLPADHAFNFSVGGGGGFTVKLRTQQATTAYEVWTDKMREGGWALGGVELRPMPNQLVITEKDLLTFELETQMAGPIQLRTDALQRLEVTPVDRARLLLMLYSTEGQFSAVIRLGAPLTTHTTYKWENVKWRNGRPGRSQWWYGENFRFHMGAKSSFPSRTPFPGTLAISKQAALAYEVWLDSAREKGFGGLMQRLVRR